MSDAPVTVAEARQRVHDIIRADTPFDDKASRTLELATECLGMDSGYLTRIDRESNHWEAVVTAGTADGQFPSELELDLQDTFCRQCLSDEAPFTLHNASEQGWADDAAVETSGFHTYLGVPLIIDDGPYGTVCLVAGEPRSEPFSDTELQFVEHLALLLERELERETIENKLTTQTNFSTVLNRVLRHNLRNDITVIRGMTEVIADQLDDESTVETILDNIDEIIDLSQKARELERVITDSSERHYTEIGSLVEEIADTLTRDYPHASISVDYDEDIQLAVLQNFDRAVEELIENAVKHGGDRPAVSVAVDRLPDSVEIRISDGGPGLPDNEAEVLETGAETPLTHGSGVGLWMANWVVTSHDGSLDAVVTETGTTLTVTLPRKPSVGVQKQLTELTRSRDTYRATFEETTDAIAIVDDEGRIIEANSTIGTVFGLDSKKVVGRPLAAFLPDAFEFDDESREFDWARDERETVRLVGADGRERVLEYSAVAGITPEQHLFVGRDISERVEREQELAKKNRQLEAIVQNTSEAIYIKDEAGYYQFINESGARLFDRTPDEIIGKHDEDIFDPQSVAEIRADDRQVMDSGDGMTEETIRFIDGAEHVFIDNKYPYRNQDGEIIGMVGISPDITKRKENERALESRTRAIDKAPVGITLSDPTRPDNPMVYVNERFCEQSGYEYDEAVGRNCRFMQGADTDPETVNEIRTAIDQGEPTTTVLRNYRKDGTMFWNRLSIAPVRDETGAITNWVGFQEDVTERVDRQRQLTLAETLFDNTQDALFVIEVTEEQEFRIQLVNDIYEELTGLANDELQGKSPRDVVGDEVGSEIEAKYRDCVERRETIKYTETVPVAGEPRNWQTKITPVISDGTVVTLVGAMRDVSGASQ